MSIAYDVTTEMARRIVNEALESDQKMIVIYRLQDGNDGSVVYYPFFQAWRYQNSLYVKTGYLCKFLEALMIKSRDALASMLYPPSSCRSYRDFVLLYIVLPGNHSVPEKFEWPRATSLPTLLNEHFPKRALGWYVNTAEDEGGIESFLKEKMTPFIWNILC